MSVNQPGTKAMMTRAGTREADSPENLSQSVADKLDAGEVSAVRTGTEPEDTGKRRCTLRQLRMLRQMQGLFMRIPMSLKRDLPEKKKRKLLTQPVVQRAQNVAEPGRNAVEISKSKRSACYSPNRTRKKV